MNCTFHIVLNKEQIDEGKTYIITYPLTLEKLSWSHNKKYPITYNPDTHTFNIECNEGVREFDIATFDRKINDAIFVSVEPSYELIELVDYIVETEDFYWGIDYPDVEEIVY